MSAPSKAGTIAALEVELNRLWDELAAMTERRTTKEPAGKRDSLHARIRAVTDRLNALGAVDSSRK